MSATSSTVTEMAAQSVDPMAFREWMAPHVAAIRLFTSAVDDVLNEKQHPGTESVAMAEIATEQNYKSRSAWEFPFTDTHSFAGATLRAASDYARSFAELFAADRPPIYAQFPVARAALEAAGVSAWLSELGIAPLDRLKRGLCELLYSANEVSSLELSDDSNQAVELWIGVADSFGWNVNNGRTKPVIDGTRRPRISESISQLAGLSTSARSGDLLFSRLSAADHVTWFGLTWAMDIKDARRTSTSMLATVPIGTTSKHVCTIAFYVVRSLRTAAATHFRFMGWTPANWANASTSAEQLEARLLGNALQDG